MLASSKYDEGISKCIGILTQLGEAIPPDITFELYANEVVQVEQLLSGNSRQELLSLPKMSDPQKLVSAPLLQKR